MAFESLEEFINAADKVGEVLYGDGADLELDVGGLTELRPRKLGRWSCSISLPDIQRIPGRRQRQSHAAPFCAGDGIAD
jgi:hypothetical protein